MEFDELLKHPSLKGAAIGCAALERWDVACKQVACKREVAHAHLAGRHDGWACFRSLHELNATTLRHEIAHLVRGNDRHDDSWRREVRALGGRVEQRYRKRSR